jgi:arsenate reductase (glutaredoxin)
MVAPLAASGNATFLRSGDVSDDDVRVFFNPRCSKCRTVKGILEERGIEPDYVRYLEQAPTREELERVLELLGTKDPRDMMRRGEELYRSLDLDRADREQLLDAMVTHPILIERPIIIHGGRAVIGRPPERALDLFGD